jgi:hypothetical protein
MCRALFAHPQEVLHKRISTPILVQPTDITRSIPSAVRVAPPEDEQVMLETRRGP